MIWNKFKMRFANTNSCNVFFFNSFHNCFGNISIFFLNYFCAQFSCIFKIIDQMPLCSQGNFIQRFLWSLHIQYIPFTVIIRGKPCCFANNILRNFMIGRNTGQEMFMPPGSFFCSYFIIYFSFYLSGHFFQCQFPELKNFFRLEKNFVSACCTLAMVINLSFF